jgi:hypothetical protein
MRDHGLNSGAGLRSRGRQFREKVEGMDRDRRWAEVMRCLDGGRGWEDRGGMLMAVLDLVCSVTKV